LAGCDPRGALFLDTETTGLGGGAGILAFLVGMAFFEGPTLCLEQLLLRSPSEETALLAHVVKRIERATLIVTYNGKAFDWPLLNGRQLMNRLPALPVRPHLDLLHVGRRLHRNRLGVCKLTSLESEVLGFVRGPDIAGGDIAARYGHFLRSGDEEALRGVVEHNAFDVMSMAALMALYGEPLGTLHDSDLVGLARTFKRAGALERADEVAHAAVARGAGPAALRIRAQIAKARGDRARALSDFEALSAEIRDAELYLELAKLYEHHVKQPLKALEFVDLGTGETPEAVERRRARLRRKAERPPKTPRRKRSGSA
ncbi:MAG TPA: ribonuclease H-like domain-containing protein, partial [Polyangiaceae bacterium]|nr:ribonuclease H-like domain-containing protein [Polyangiaceae bacterium]